MPHSRTSRLVGSFKARATGRSFEAAVICQAAIEDLLIVQHGHRARFLPGGRTIAVRSDLDFRLADRLGRLAIFDTKSLPGGTIPVSSLTPHQVDRARRYCTFSLRAGFVVLLRQTGSIFWVPVSIVASRGSVPLAAATPLGTVTSFALGPILQAKR